MSLLYYENLQFYPKDLKDSKFLVAEYDHCEFHNLFISGSDLSSAVFQDCIFQDCDLSLVKLKKTSFRKTTFKGCKMLGLRFDECHDFLLSVGFENCNLDMSIFNGVKLKKTRYVDSQLRETDFTDADLESAVFTNCNLENSTFENTNLQFANFNTSYGYKIDPELNRVKNASFSWPAASGLLTKYGINIK